MLILAAFMIIAMVGICALTIDVGYLMIARTQLQQSADAAALAACAELIDDEALSSTPGMTDEIANARNMAVQYAALNKVCNTSPTVAENVGNLSGGDIVVGSLAHPFPAEGGMDFAQPQNYNAVQVSVRRTTASNGEVNLFFAKLFGFGSRPMEASATAVLLTNFSGFHAAADGSNLDLLPFALDIDTWEDLLAGGVTTDNWRWDAGGERVLSGSDGIKEVNLFPQSTGSPGNRGTVDIGSSNNSTADIARQITEGVSPSDLAHFPNSELKFDGNGELNLNGDTGISAGVKDELASIVGETRIIPIFESVSGPGNNANYVIVAFTGVRIMDVMLTGKPTGKRLMIQPAHVVAKGAIPASGPPKSYYTFTKPWLIR